MGTHPLTFVALASLGVVNVILFELSSFDSHQVVRSQKLVEPSRAPTPQPIMMVKANVTGLPTCICNGSVAGGTKVISLSSPWFSDGMYLQPGESVDPSCCAGLQLDTDRTHVVISARTSQYGHFLFNDIAPLWEKVRRNQKPLVVHLFLKLMGDQPYMREYLSMFGEAHVYSCESLNKTTLYLDSPVLGLSNTTLDHFNPKSDPKKWHGFRKFLLAGNRLSEPRQSANELRFTIIQRGSSGRPRSSDRKILELDAVVAKLQASLGAELIGKRPVFQVVEFEGATVAEQARVMSETDVLIGADGTGLFNGIYMPTNSCVISILPYGVQQLIPDKGINFEQLFSKLDMKYVKFGSLPVNGSTELYRRAEQLPSKCCDRYFLIDQDIRVDHAKLLQAVRGCFETTSSQLA